MQLLREEARHLAVALTKTYRDLWFSFIHVHVETRTRHVCGLDVFPSAASQSYSKRIRKVSKQFRAGSLTGGNQSGVALSPVDEYPIYKMRLITIRPALAPSLFQWEPRILFSDFFQFAKAQLFQFNFASVDVTTKLNSHHDAFLPIVIFSTWCFATIFPNVSRRLSSCRSGKLFSGLKERQKMQRGKKWYALLPWKAWA